MAVQYEVGDLLAQSLLIIAFPACRRQHWWRTVGLTSTLDSNSSCILILSEFAREMNVKCEKGKQILNVIAQNIL